MSQPQTQLSAAHIEMSCLIAVNTIMQTESGGIGRFSRPLSAEQRVEKALNLMMQKEAELKHAGGDNYQPSTEFMLFSAQLSKAYNMIRNGNNEVAAKTVNGIKIRSEEALLPKNSNRFASLDPELVNDESARATLILQGQERAEIYRTISAAHNHTEQEKCADAVCSKSMAATALTSQVNQLELNKFAAEKNARY